MELMNLLLDAMNNNNNHNSHNRSHNHNNHHGQNSKQSIDRRSLQGLALIYGNIGASKVIDQRYPETLSTRDALRGQLPLHIACHTGMMIEDDETDDFDDDGFSITTGATGRSSVTEQCDGAVSFDANDESIDKRN